MDLAHNRNFDLVASLIKQATRTGCKHCGPSAWNITIDVERDMVQVSWKDLKSALQLSSFLRQVEAQMEKHLDLEKRQIESEKKQNEEFEQKYKKYN